MFLTLLTLVIAALLAGAALGILALLIIGIRRGDRARLNEAPESHSGAIARRILAGVRSSPEGEEDNQ